MLCVVTVLMGIESTNECKFVLRLVANCIQKVYIGQEFDIISCTVNSQRISFTASLYYKSCNFRQKIGLGPSKEMFCVLIMKLLEQLHDLGSLDTTFYYQNHTNGYFFCILLLAFFFLQNLRRE